MRLLPLFLILFTATTFARVWTDDKGREVEAELVSQTDDAIVLRLANNSEVPFPKARLSPEDLAFLEAEAAKAPAEEPETETSPPAAEGPEGRAFPVNPSERANSPWYYVAEADKPYTPPKSEGGSWVTDPGRSSIEPAPVTFPMTINKGVQRIVNARTKERIVVLGTEDYDLLEQTAALELYQSLKISEKQAVMAVLSANYLEHGKASRAAIKPLLADEEFTSKSKNDQKEAFLLALEKSSPDLNRDFDLSSFQETEWNEKWKKESSFTTFQIKEPVVAWETEIKVDGANRVTVFSVREDDTVGVEAIRKGLSCLPPEMVEFLEVISLQYNGNGFWWGGGNEIYYSAVEDLKFNGSLVYVMAHEVGHCIQAQKVKGSWNEALENCIVFPSAYGLTNQAEDFAEFASIVTRAWVDPHLMIEIEEVFPWRHQIYTKALGYKRAKSRGASKLDEDSP